MHPIERLRYVARAGSAPDRILVSESVPALAAFARKPQALLVAVRQLIVRQPDSPGLYALAAHMIHALDAIDAGWDFAALLEQDRTAEIAESIAITEAGGTDVIDSIASGRGAGGAVDVLCPAGTTAWIAHAREGGRSVAVVTPVGTRLPAMLWAGFLERNGLSSPEPTTGESERIPLDAFDDLIGPDGIQPLSAWEPDAPDVAEIARF